MKTQIRLYSFRTVSCKSDVTTTIIIAGMFRNKPGNIGIEMGKKSFMTTGVDCESS